MKGTPQMTTPTAEVVETKEPEPIGPLRVAYAVHYRCHYNGKDLEALNWPLGEWDEEKQLTYCREYVKIHPHERCCIIRLPRDAELQPLRDAVNRAAVELARHMASLVHDPIRQSNLLCAFMDAESALAAAQAAQGEKP